jgi:hypothetical protein
MILIPFNYLYILFVIKCITEISNLKTSGYFTLIKQNKNGNNWVSVDGKGRIRGEVYG